MTNQIKFRLPVLTLIIISIMMSLCLVFSGCGGGSGGGSQGGQQASFTSTPPMPETPAPVASPSPAPSVTPTASPSTPSPDISTPPSLPSLAQLKKNKNIGKRDVQNVNLSAGWNSISFPFDSLNSTSGFTHQLFKWDGSQYQRINPANAGSIDCSYGYWAYSSTPTSISAEGTYTGSKTSVVLHYGWNFFGFPQREAKKFSDITLTYNGETKTLADASSPNTTPPITSWVYTWALYYNDNSWRFLKASNGNNEFQPWKGYWLWSWVDGAKLNFKPKYAYVTNASSDNISIIDTFTHSIVDTIQTTGNGPDSVTINSAGTKAYVTYLFSDTISEISLVDNAVIDILQEVPGVSGGIAITSDDMYMYVIYVTYPRYSVSKIDLSIKQVIATIEISDMPWYIAITPDGSKIYVAHNEGFYSDHTVSVIDTVTNKVLATIDTGTLGRGIAITPNGKYVYVCDFNPNGTVSVIRTTDNTVIDTISVGTSPWGLVIGTIGSGAVYAYVTNFGSDDVSVIDTATNQVIATVPIGDGPFYPALTSDGAYLYVPLQYSNAVAVMSTATNQIVATIPVGAKPRSIAIQH